MWVLLVFALSTTQLPGPLGPDDEAGDNKAEHHDRATFRLGVKEDKPDRARLKALAEKLREAPEILGAAAVHGRPEIRVDYDFDRWQEADVIEHVRKLEEKAALAGPIERVAQDAHVSVVITPARRRFELGGKAGFRLAYEPKKDAKIHAAVILWYKLFTSVGETREQGKELEDADRKSTVEFELDCPGKE